MTMTADQRLIAYLDNELSAEERAQFEADMAKDEWLSAEVAKHRGLAARIAAAHAPAPDAPAPGRLRIMPAPARRVASGQWVAMAVCVVLGVALGVAYWPLQGMVEAPVPAGPGPGPAAGGPLGLAKGGVLIAEGTLEKALTTSLAAEGGPVAVGLTFMGRNGRYCRTFQSIPDHLAGVACREADDHWVIQTTTRFMPTAPTADYRQIGADVPVIILDSVDALKAGPPLSALDERAARDGGWKPAKTEAAGPANEAAPAAKAPAEADPASKAPAATSRPS